MKKITAFVLVSAIALSANSQKVSGKLTFQQGQQFSVSTSLVINSSVEAMGQSIPIKVNGSINDLYLVTNTTDDNTTLHHENKRIVLNMEQMGQQVAFDTDNEKDKKKAEAKPIMDLKEEKFDMVIDPSGKVLLVKKNGESASAPEIPGVSEVLKAAKAPQQGRASFFMILPGDEVSVGNTWSDSTSNENGSTANDYELAEITDSTIVVNVKARASNNSKGEAMGMQTETMIVTKGVGKIILDKKTGIMRRKTLESTSNGTVSVAGQELPLNSTSTLTIEVTPFTVKGF
jgi:hypothetical protein